MPKSILFLLLLIFGTASADGGLTLYLAPTDTSGLLAFCLRPDLPPDPLFRPPYLVAAGSAEEGEELLRRLFWREIRRGLPNRLPPTALLGAVVPEETVERLPAPIGGPALLITTNPLPLAGTPSRHRAVADYRTGWVGWDARYDPGSLEVYAWEWLDPRRSGGPFDNAFVVCGLCSDELGPMPPRLLWRDRLGRPRAVDATVVLLEELQPKGARWFLPGGLVGEER